MASKLFYYIRRYGYQHFPRRFFQKKYDGLRNFEKSADPKEIEDRLRYYFKIDNAFPLPEQSVSIDEYKRKGSSEYFLDLKDFFHFFERSTRFAYRFGDHTNVQTWPTLFKARPIEGENSNSILFKLNKRRHFQWVDDAIPFEAKKDRVVWRGGAYHELRKNLVRRLWDHDRCNIGQTNSPKENVPWQKEFLSKEDQLQNKFVLCPEGNDVATNLKWAMSSNSLCIMPKPRYETWFMEGILEAGIHYVQIKDDASDLDEKLDYYIDNTQEAKKIITAANRHVTRFQNPLMEELLGLKVLEKYAVLSGQKNALKFQA